MLKGNSNQIKLLIHKSKLDKFAIKLKLKPKK